MRQIYGETIEVDSVTNERGLSTEIPCTVPTGEQANKASVQVTLQDAAADASLVVSVEGSLDRIKWVNQATTASFGSTGTSIITPFDASGIGWIRARVTTGGASAAIAQVTFILTRTP